MRANPETSDDFTSLGRTVLVPPDHAAFFAVLDDPPEPTPALRAAVARYRRRVVSR